ncbi:hypothetical protein NQZ79_g5899 [Umbelopsis isabellina]|nr:hypothetical protein NQZ79_g5899 [Umbelopsis isabellina]
MVVQAGKTFRYWAEGRGTYHKLLHLQTPKGSRKLAANQTVALSLGQTSSVVVCPKHRVTSMLVWFGISILMSKQQEDHSDYSFDDNATNSHLSQGK